MQIVLIVLQNLLLYFPQETLHKTYLQRSSSLNNNTYIKIA